MPAMTSTAYQDRWNLWNAEDRGGVGPHGGPSLSIDQAAAQLTRSNLSWSAVAATPATITFAFRTTPGTMPDGTSEFSQFTTAQINATLLALQSWSDVANVVFVRVQDTDSAYSDDATILFGNYRFDDGPDYQPLGLSYAPGSTAASSRDGDVWVQWEPGSGATPQVFRYEQLVLVREIGHALGLSYGSLDDLPTFAFPYFTGASGTASTPAWYEDTRQYSIMSPFSEELSGADYMVAALYRMPAAPMLDDIAAAQRLYGANMTTRAGDTIYGFNSTADRPWFTPNAAGELLFAVWDAGGVDTFDFSGFVPGGVIDLREGHFSSVGPRPNVGPFVGNVAIAMGTIIENAIGGSGDDQIHGNAVANQLSGRDGNDVIVGAGGNDTIDGGDGYDVAGYAGARKNYGTVNSTTVVGGREGGADTLVGIEAAAFVDGLTTFNADSQAAQLMRLYSAAFDRAPDALGFQIQLDAIEAGVTFDEMARRFLTSDEFTGRFGALTNTQYIQRLYQNAFDRQPSNAEINDWLTYLNAGNSRQSLMVVIAESAESRAATWTTLSAGLWVGDAVSESLARMFDTVFDRLPDEGGLITWRASMAGGATLLDVATAFLASAEGQARYAGLSNAQFVDAVYQAALNRAPDSGGQATYLAALNSGALTRAQMLVSVSESAEHQALTLPVYVGGIPTQTAPAPAPLEGAHDDLTGPQTLPATDDAKHHDDGAQTLPALDDGGKDAGAQTLPADPDGGAVDAKDGGPQVIPAIDDGAQVVPVADAGKDAGAQVVPALSDDDFVPLALVDAGAQTTPLHVAVDLDALFASHDQIGVERALDALPMVAVDPLDATHPGGGDAHHLGHDAFQ